MGPYLLCFLLWHGPDIGVHSVRMHSFSSSLWDDVCVAFLRPMAGAQCGLAECEKTPEYYQDIQWQTHPVFWLTHDPLASRMLQACLPNQTVVLCNRTSPTSFRMPFGVYHLQLLWLSGTLVSSHFTIHSCSSQWVINSRHWIAIYDCVLIQHGKVNVYGQLVPLFWNKQYGVIGLWVWWLNPPLS